MTERLLTTDDALARLAADERAYVAERFTPTRPDAPGPGPAYVADDGTPLYPRDAAACDREGFVARFVAAGGPADDAGAAWDDYAEGIYGMCLRAPSPETVAEKGRLVEAIDALLRDARPAERAWCERLRDAVERLDAVEAPFAPLDFVRLGARPSRFRLIEDVHERFPEAFERRVASESPAERA